MPAGQRYHTGQGHHEEGSPARPGWCLRTGFLALEKLPPVPGIPLARA